MVFNHHDQKTLGIHKVFEHDDRKPYEFIAVRKQSRYTMLDPALHAEDACGHESRIGTIMVRRCLKMMVRISMKSHMVLKMMIRIPMNL